MFCTCSLARSPKSHTTYALSHTYIQYIKHIYTVRQPTISKVQRGYDNDSRDGWRWQWSVYSKIYSPCQLTTVFVPDLEVIVDTWRVARSFSKVVHGGRCSHLYLHYKPFLMYAFRMQVLQARESSQNHQQDCSLPSLVSVQCSSCANVYCLYYIIQFANTHPFSWRRCGMQVDVASYNEAVMSSTSTISSSVAVTKSSSMYWNKNRKCQNGVNAQNWLKFLIIDA